jgi:membrane-bound serine protease (ClpP class)
MALVALIAGTMTAFAQEAGVLPTSSNLWARISQIVVNPWVTIGLLVVGCSFLFYEMLTPKTWGVAGNTGATCVGTFLLGSIIHGDTGWLGALLLLAGLVFVLLEVHLYPGTGASVAGFILMYAGMFQSLGGVANAGFALPTTIFLLIVAVLAFLTYLPKSPAWKAMSRRIHEQQVYTAINPPESTLTPEEKQYLSPEFLTGLRGTAITPLHPTGVVQFANFRRAVVTEGDFLEAGAIVIVRRVEGERVLVEAVPIETTKNISPSERTEALV